MDKSFILDLVFRFALLAWPDNQSESWVVRNVGPQPAKGKFDLVSKTDEWHNMNEQPDQPRKRSTE